MADQFTKLHHSADPSRRWDRKYCCNYRRSAHGRKRQAIRVARRRLERADPIEDQDGDE